MFSMRRPQTLAPAVFWALQLSGAVAAWAQEAPAALPIQLPAASERLDALVEEYWTWVQENRDPLDISLDSSEERAAYAARVLERLEAIDGGELTYDERLTAQVLEWEAQAHVDALEVYWYGFPYTPYGPLRIVGLQLARRFFQSEEHLDAYQERLGRYHEPFIAIREQAAGQQARGIVLPAEQLDRSLRFLRGFLRPAESSPFYVAGDLLAAFPDERVRSFQDAVSELISESINPAVEELIAFVEELRPHAPAGVGISRLPGGRDAYRRLVRSQTTLDATPEEIHAIGLAAVDSLNAEMAKVRDALGFTGTKAEFHEQLRRDPHFFVDTPDEFGERLMEHDARIRPLIETVFFRQPERAYGVARLDLRLEPELTYGYYSRPGADQPKGLYLFKGSDLDQRSLLSAAALTFHELVPGHHFQINLVLENEELSQFRRQVHYSGYGEGWAEYASSVVARELGMYADPYDYYGRLVFDMFFAVRLVVDTGVNYLGWPRKRAQAFMLEHTMESEVQVDSETLRYTHWPAQALAYWMGRRAFVEARGEAERELGDRFDIRRFHDWVLSTGRLPLPVMRAHVQEFIAREREPQGVVTR